jgi:hypothetical protein
MDVFDRCIVCSQSFERNKCKTQSGFDKFNFGSRLLKQPVTVLQALEKVSSYKAFLRDASCAVNLHSYLCWVLRSPILQFGRLNR